MTTAATSRPLNSSDVGALTFDPAGRSGGRFGAMIYNRALAAGERKGMRDRRGRLVSKARGVTLEIGAGTGLNLEHYPDSVDQLILTEPVRAMAKRIDTSGDHPFPIRVAWADAEHLPVADGSVDTVVSTMVLCTVEDVSAALAEIARVLSPGGRLLFTEHVRADGERLGRWQNRLARPWAIYADGCRCNQDTLSALESGFDVEISELAEWDGMPALVRPLISGEATIR